jgi:amidophosphoribosyltransferase
MEDHQEYPRHYCGVFGVWGHPGAASLTYYGLFALQHRGQESAGIVSCDERGEFHTYRGMGLVSQVFNEDVLPGLKGNIAIGHTRYSTTGSSQVINAQPLTVDFYKGKVAIAHNGNLTNAARLRWELEQNGSIFQTTIDSEIILHLLAQPHDEPSSEQTNLIHALRRIQGAFSLVLMTGDALIGVRDPQGFRPLSIARLGDGGYALSSETCAFDLIQAEFIRDVEPGEVVVIDKKGIRSFHLYSQPQRRAFCIFEHVYFARPDSILGGKSVYQTRVEMGRQLAREYPIEADIVVPIPDSGNCAALGYSIESGVPYEMAFVRNHYVGRSFLQPSQLIRDFNVRVKLNLVKDLVKGKRVIIVDDSIVRGTTSKAHVNNLKEAGATEVHILVSCPPHRYSCYYGIDFPDRNKLMAVTHSLDEIATYLNADSVNYLSVKGMVQATGGGNHHFCMACYDGDYPVTYDSTFTKEVNEQRTYQSPSLVDQLDSYQQQMNLFDIDNSGK